MDSLHEDVLEEFRRGVDDATLIDVSVNAIETLLSAPAAALARQAALSGKRPDPDHLEEVFSLVWRSVSRS